MNLYSSGQPIVINIPHDPRIMGNMSQAYSLVDLGKRLLDSAKNGDMEEVRALMSNGAPFTTDWLGSSPLHFAAMNGHYGTCEVLLRAGISRDARTKVDRTPLHLAAQEGHADLVELLLRHSADIEAKDMLKMTALHWAAERGHCPVIQVLLRYGADHQAVNKFQLTAQEIASNKRYGEAAAALSCGGLVAARDHQQQQQHLEAGSSNGVVGAAEYLVMESDGDVMPLAAAEVEVGGHTDSEELVDVVSLVASGSGVGDLAGDAEADADLDLEPEEDSDGGIVEQLAKLAEEAEGGEIQIQGLPEEMSSDDAFLFLETQGVNITARCIDASASLHQATAQHGATWLSLTVRHEPGVLSLTVVSAERPQLERMLLTGHSVSGAGAEHHHLGVL